jgi:transposase InsO family protein
MDNCTLRQLAKGTARRSHWLELKPELRKFLANQSTSWELILKHTALAHQADRLERECRACQAAADLIKRLRKQAGKTVFPRELKGFIAHLGFTVERTSVCAFFQIFASNLATLCRECQPLTDEEFLSFYSSAQKPETNSQDSETNSCEKKERREPQKALKIDKASDGNSGRSGPNNLPTEVLPCQHTSSFLPSDVPFSEAHGSQVMNFSHSEQDSEDVIKTNHADTEPHAPFSPSRVLDEDEQARIGVNESRSACEESPINEDTLCSTVLIHEIRYSIDEAQKILEKSLEGRKTRRRFSDKERKLLLFLAECLGSKFVHEKFLVTYDTISRLRRERKRQDEQKSTSVKPVLARYANILEIMKKHPGMGPMQIRDYIHRHESKSMGVNTVRNIMIDAGWIPPVSRKRELLSEEFRRYEAVRRNVIWHADFLHCHINSCKAYVLFIQDDYSRFIVGHGIFDGESFSAVIDTFERAMSLHGKPEAFISDKGSAFWAWRGISQFTQVLEDYGIDQMTCNAPRTNGKVENLNQQFDKEMLSAERYSSLEMFQTAVIKWVSFYNFERCHQGLAKLEIPADRFYPGMKERKAAEKPSANHLFFKTLLEALSSQFSQS